MDNLEQVSDKKKNLAVDLMNRARLERWTEVWIELYPHGGLAVCLPYKRDSDADDLMSIDNDRLEAGEWGHDLMLFDMVFGTLHHMRGNWIKRGLDWILKKHKKIRFRFEGGEYMAFTEMYSMLGKSFNVGE